MPSASRVVFGLFVLLAASVHGSEGVATAPGVEQALRSLERVSSCSGGPPVKLSIQLDPAAWLPLAEMAVRMSNWLTRLHMRNETLSEAQLYAYLASNLDGGGSPIAGSWACYDLSATRLHAPFSPTARRRSGSTLALDASLPCDSLVPDDLYALVKKRSWSDIPFSRVVLQARANTSVELTQPMLTVANGSWSLPYYDCAGGGPWLLSYVLPFFTVSSTTRPMLQGVVGVDVDLSGVDVNQCDDESDSAAASVFLGSHHCDAATTRCHVTRGRGFRRGSYECRCLDGFYFPNQTAALQAYDGRVVEQYADSHNATGPDGPFRCLPCAEGCGACADASPCVMGRDAVTRGVVLAASVLGLLALTVFILVIARCRKQHSLRAGSPLFLAIMCVGGMLLQVKVVVRFASPSLATCTAALWLELLGFAVLFGAMLLKTRRSVYLASDKTTRPAAVSDCRLLRRLVPIVLPAAVFLASWTAAVPDPVTVRVTRSALKFSDCTASWWLLAAHVAETLLLLWGACLCFEGRKAPAASSESRHVTWAIGNALLTGNGILVLIHFVAAHEGPDLVYILEWTRIAVIAIGSVGIVLAPKLYALQHPPLLPTLAHTPAHADASSPQTSQGTQTDSVITGVLQPLDKDTPAATGRDDGASKGTRNGGTHLSSPKTNTHDDPTPMRGEPSASLAAAVSSQDSATLAQAGQGSNGSRRRGSSSPPMASQTEGDDEACVRGTASATPATNAAEHASASCADGVGAMEGEGVLQTASEAAEDDASGVWMGPSSKSPLPAPFGLAGVLSAMDAKAHWTPSSLRGKAPSDGATGALKGQASCAAATTPVLDNAEEDASGVWMGPTNPTVSYGLPGVLSAMGRKGQWTQASATVPDGTGSGKRQLDAATTLLVAPDAEDDASGIWMGPVNPAVSPSVEASVDKSLLSEGRAEAQDDGSGIWMGPANASEKASSQASASSAVDVDKRRAATNVPNAAARAEAEEDASGIWMGPPSSQAHAHEPVSLSWSGVATVLNVKSQLDVSKKASSSNEEDDGSGIWMGPPQP